MWREKQMQVQYLVPLLALPKAKKTGATSDRIRPIILPDHSPGCQWM